MQSDGFEALVNEDLNLETDQNTDKKEEENGSAEELDLNIKEGNVSAKECLFALAKVCAFCKVEDLEMSVHLRLKEIESRCFQDHSNRLV